jgi:hypothetical protein
MAEILAELDAIDAIVRLDLCLIIIIIYEA